MKVGFVWSSLITLVVTWRAIQASSSPSLERKDLACPSFLLATKTIPNTLVPGKIATLKVRVDDAVKKDSSYAMSGGSAPKVNFPAGLKYSK